MFRRTLLKLGLALALAVAAPAHAAGGHVQIDSDTTTRAAAILTTSYVGATSIADPYASQANCLVSMTLGSLTTIEVKAQFSQNDSTWFDELERQSPTVTAASGIDQSIGLAYPKIYQFNDSADVLISTPLLGRYFRLAIKGTGTVTSSSATIRCVVGAL